MYMISFHHSHLNIHLIWFEISYRCSKPCPQVWQIMTENLKKTDALLDQYLEWGRMSHSTANWDTHLWLGNRTKHLHSSISMHPYLLSFHSCQWPCHPCRQQRAPRKLLSQPFGVHYLFISLPFITIIGCQCQQKYWIILNMLAWMVRGTVSPLGPPFLGRHSPPLTGPLSCLHTSGRERQGTH